MNKLLFVLILITALLIPIIAINTLAAADDCREDIWDCTAWSACSVNGEQTRTCTLVETCPNADNDKPLEMMDCEYASTLSKSLECADLATLKQRIQCRLDLKKDPPSGLNIAFMPEECSTLFDAASKDACILRYSNAQSCWNSDSTTTDKCLKKQLNLNDLQSRKNACNDASCLATLSDDVDILTKFRIQELQNRAEAMLNKGLISESDAIDIIYYLEQQKLAYNNAPTSADKIRYLENVKDKWIEFIDGLR
jgi:hypothetical protein